MPQGITYEVMVDWDMTDWADDPDFTGTYDDISNDVASISWIRGKEREAGNSPASTLEIKMQVGLCSKYSPVNTTGDLYLKLLPWRIIRVRAYFGTTWYNLFFGYISKYRINPHPDIQSVSLYCTDGLDLLARQLVKQDYNTRTSMSDGTAIGHILDAAGWSTSRRDIDTDGGSKLLNYPTVGVY